MKNLFCKLVSVVLCLCMLTGASVFAEEPQSNPLSVEYKLEIASNELQVFGTVVSTKGGVPLVLRVTRGDEIIAADSTFSEGVVNGTSAYTFSGVPFPSNSLSGSYNIYVSADYVKAERTVVYPYIGVDRRLELLEDINQAVESEDGAGILSAISDNYDVMSIEPEELNNLSEDTKAIIEGLMLAAGAYEIPDSFVTDAELAQIDSAIKLMCANYANSLKIASAADITSKEEFTAYLTKFGETESFYLDEEDTAYDEAVMAKYFDEALENTALYAKLKAVAQKAESFKELKDGMLKGAVITLLESGRYTEIEAITKALPELFSSIDGDKLDALTDAKKVAVYQEMASASFTDIEDFSKQFNEAVKANSGSTPSGKTPAGGRSPSRDQDTIIISPNPVSGVPVDSKGHFDDLTECEWAREAIEALADKNIVSGKGNGLFDPFTSVTRAEFVKMAAGAFGLGVRNYNGEFADVSRNDWHAPYVASAYAAGIVEGNNGSFNPGGHITREDMAVILFRGLQLSESENYRDVFYDSDAMSEYAKAAIFAMYEKGIIKGRGNGLFEPKGLATRAEAAQMIYNAIQLR